MPELPDWAKKRLEGEKIMQPVPVGDLPDWAKERLQGSGEPGSTPETAFNEEVPDKDFPGRFGLQNFTAGPEHIRRELERRGFETKDTGDDFLKIRSKENGRWYQLEKKGFSGGGFLAGAKEAGKDILDVTGGALNLAGQGIGHIVGAAGGALVGGPAAPVTGFTGGVVGGGAGAGVADLARTEIGKRIFGFEPEAEERVKSAAIEGAYGVGGELIAPLLKPLLKGFPLKNVPGMKNVAAQRFARTEIEPRIPGVAQALKAPYVLQEKLADYAEKGFTRVGEKLGRAGGAGKFVPPPPGLMLEVLPKVVREPKFIDPGTGRVIEEVVSRYAPHSIQELHTQTLKKNVGLLKELKRLLGPGFFQEGFSQTIPQRKRFIAHLLSGMAPAEQAKLAADVKAASPLLREVFSRTIGPRGGLAEKLYGLFGRRFLGPSMGYGLAAKAMGLPFSSGLTMTAAVPAAHVAGRALEEGATRIPQSAFYALAQLLQRSQRRKDLEEWLKERGQEMREKIAPAKKSPAP